MTIVLVDDGSVYDGATPEQRALGGRERAVVALARALSSLGHDVTVFNRCPGEVVLEGVHWRVLPDDWAIDPPLAQVDTLIAVGNPALLAVAAEARRRVLWVLGSPSALAHPEARALLSVLRPALAVPGLTAYNTLPVGGGTVVLPGVEDVFVPDHAPDGFPPPPDPPVAVVTTHPAQGLAALLDVWRTRIHPEVPTARLHLYSALLFGARQGGLLPAALTPLAEAVEALAPLGVEVRAPLPSPAMAAVYRAASVHLYPAAAHDMVCWTLGDSQACGLPAVAYPRGAAGERLINGETGYLVPDAEAFGNVACQILGHPEVWRSLATQAAQPERRRTWRTVARAFERLMV